MATMSYLVDPMAHLWVTVCMPVTNEARTKTGVARQKQPSAGIRLRIQPCQKNTLLLWRLEPIIYFSLIF